MLSEEKLATWEIYNDKLFESCYLIGREDDDAFIVDFAHPGLREKLKSYFKEKQHFFWQTQFTILEEHALLFNPNINSEISNSIIDLFIDNLKDDPEYYDDLWFRRNIYAIKNFEGTGFVIAGDTEEEKADNLLWDFIERNGLTTFFYNRLADILIAMLQKELGKRVHDYLNSLVNFGHHDVLLRLVQKLSGIDGFDKFYWLKQLIDRGKVQIKNEAYHWMVYSLAAKDPFKAWSVVKSWLPQNKKISSYSPANHYAGFFIIHFYVNELINLEVNRYGNWPSDYSLFQSNQGEMKSCQEHIRFIISQARKEETEYQFSNANASLLLLMSIDIFLLNWSKKDHLDELFEIDEKNYLKLFSLGHTPTYDTLLADIIEAWFHVLKGFSDAYHPDARELNGFLIKSVVELWGLIPNNLTNIIKHWEKKPAIYKKQHDGLKQYAAEHSEYLTEEEKNIGSDFINFIKKRKDNIEFLFEELNKHI